LGLKGYIARRIIYTLILIWAIITVNFLIFNALPGSPIEAYIASLKGSRPEAFRRLAEHFGLNKSLHEKYLITLKNLITFDFGYSDNFGAPIIDVITRERLPNTLILMGTAEVITILIGMLLGVIVAYKRGGVLDTTIVTGSLLTYSVPIFFIAWLLITFFCLYLHWLPTSFAYPVTWIRNPPSNIIEIISGRIYHLILPTITLVIFSVGGWILLTRACILETITEDYVITARAKGLKERTVLYKHVLKNASLPIITNVALAFAGMVGGATITETLFNYKGMGRLIYDAIFLTGGGSDIPLLGAIFYILALCVVVANFLADLIYGVIDPRIKYD